MCARSPKDAAVLPSQSTTCPEGKSGILILCSDRGISPRTEQFLLSTTKTIRMLKEGEMLEAPWG